MANNGSASNQSFNPKAKKDASLQDFEAFFAPNGTLDNFYNNQLRMFIEENITVNDGENAQSLIRKDVLGQIKQAQKIRDAFFNRKGILDVSFSVEPLRLSGNKRRSRRAPSSTTINNTRNCSRYTS